MIIGLVLELAGLLGVGGTPAPPPGGTRITTLSGAPIITLSGDNLVTES